MLAGRSQTEEKGGFNPMTTTLLPGSGQVGAVLEGDELGKYDDIVKDLHVDQVPSTRKSIFGGSQIFLVEKIYFGIHFQFLSPQSKTNVLSVGNKNCKLKILNQEITVNAQPIRFQ